MAVSMEMELDVEQRCVHVLLSQHGIRLDKCLADLIPEFSRTYLQQLMAQGDVILEGVTATKPSLKVKAGQRIDVTLSPTDQASSFKPEPIDLNVVYEDADMLVLNKPAGMVVHPAAGNWSGTIMNGLLHHHRGASDLPRAGIVHRLDKDTSGLMVVGKTRLAVEALSRMIAAREVHRFYLAIAEKTWAKTGVMTVDEPLGRDPHNRLRMSVQPRHAASAKAAKTQFRSVAPLAGMSLIACKLFTGRTHQIRVHLSWIGHPILGDAVYGGHSLEGMSRQALHATRLELLHPVSGRSLVFLAPVPRDMEKILEGHGVTYNIESLGVNTFSPS